MTEREKVIKGLECCGKGNMCRNHCPYDGPENDIKNCTSQLARDALSLLKAQEPKKAEWTTKRTQEHDGEWYCSHCGYEPVVMWGENFCPNCGYKMTMPEPPKEG